MTPSAIVLIISTGAVCASAATPSHDTHYIYGCYESDEVRVDVLVADFSKEEVVWAMPHLPPSLTDIKKRVYEIAKASTAHCHSVLGKARILVLPCGKLLQTSSSTRGMRREDGVVNTLFCFANNFYPPTINFTWTKNGVEVTEGVSNLRYRHNSDGTFHRISTLSFTPRGEDVYSCSVEHQASQRPCTRAWEQTKRKESSLSPAAGFFAASLVLCLMGIGTGAFFFTKQPT